MLAHFDRGEFELKFVPPDPSKLFDRDWDSARLDPPTLWFADQDVATFLYQHDSAIKPCSDLIRREWIARKLPTLGPELRYSIRGTFSIPASIVERIRAESVATP